MWVASSDYHADIRVSQDILKQMSEVYRKIRNTARFILGCIPDFDPNKDCVSDDMLEEVDRYALMRLNDVVKASIDGYENFEFHMIFHAIHNFCVIDMSNFYLDVIKDRLYVEKSDSVTRRAAQTTIYRVLDTITRLVAPILAFTSEEIWKFMPHDSSCNTESVLFNEMPKPKANVDEALVARWDRIHLVRDDVKKALEIARTEKVIGASLDAEVNVYADGEMYDFLNSIDDLSAVFIVSKANLIKGGEGEFKGEQPIWVTVKHAEGEKCARCWKYSGDIGTDTKHPCLCARCASVLK